MDDSSAQIHSRPLSSEFLLRWLTDLAAAAKIQSHLWDSSSLLYDLRYELVDLDRAGVKLLGKVLSSRSTLIDSRSTLAEPLVLMTQIGFIAKRKGRWVPALPKKVGPNKIIGAYVALNKVTDPEGVPHCDRLPPFRE